MFKPNKTTASPVNTLILQILTISCVYFMCLNGCLFIWLTVSDNIFNENCICVCQDGTRHSFTLCFILCLLGVAISAVVVMKYSEYSTKMYTNGTFVGFYSWSSWKLNMLWQACTKHVHNRVRALYTLGHSGLNETQDRILQKFLLTKGACGDVWQLIPNLKYKSALRHNMKSW